MVETSDSWIREKTGISSRHFAVHRTNADMAQEAAEEALFTAGITAEEIDMLLVCTFTPDLATPSLACQVAGHLGTKPNILAMDINGACSGFVYGSTVAASMLTAGNVHRALVIGSEKISSMMDMEDRGTCILFGDGAGALVLEYDEDGIFESVAGCQPDDQILGCSRTDPAIYMSGQEVYRFATSQVPEAIVSLLAKVQMDREDIDYYVCHQANLRIIDSIARRLGVDRKKFYTNIETTGNTSAASVAICLSEMMEKGLLQSGMHVVCAGFGAGLTWGAMLMRI
jgi:3-oxoacyl-[acyl-carrier-protein] synthase-3